MCEIGNVTWCTSSTAVEFQILHCAIDSVTSSFCILLFKRNVRQACHSVCLHHCSMQRMMSSRCKQRERKKALITPSKNAKEIRNRRCKGSKKKALPLSRIAKSIAVRLRHQSKTTSWTETPRRGILNEISNLASGRRLRTADEISTCAQHSEDDSSNELNIRVTMQRAFLRV